MQNCSEPFSSGSSQLELFLFFNDEEYSFPKQDEHKLSPPSTPPPTPMKKYWATFAEKKKICFLALISWVLVN